MTDKELMQRAIELARRGSRGAHPNPIVGAVLAKRGRVIAEGWHARFGGPHAEAAALKKAGVRARGADLYVTLEPCSTYGKTPPCTEAIVAAGVARVFIGASDPNPRHSRRGGAILRAAGIRVKTGMLRRECEALNPAFSKYMRTRLPYVTLKTAQSLDGRIADAAGRSRWISSPQSRRFAHKLRAEADAVIAGVGTVLADDPLLNVRGFKVPRQPWVVILDSRLCVPPGARVFGNDRVIVVVAGKAPAAKAKRLPRHAEILELPKGPDGRPSLPALLKALGSVGISHILVEGGGKVAGSFISQGLVDRYCCIIAPMVIGGTCSRSSAVWPDRLNAASKVLGVQAEVKALSRLGPDLMLDVRFR
ncbi:MAG: bifunctional diaminohydroxyphosphoribosylaminopyrimidine deaminase/5-amino-6-(5-phosphoribosylamino)uracil reductase RibD [Elusimicrobiales bacterium]|nr:bifunctional diaminohydroxyphosphoribosylaminopyrimidine deaminase/5-amino-6-(5-phosphoribosylamino)uracil reductase RibD [Elusimicrobiales bacterium]